MREINKVSTSLHIGMLTVCDDGVSETEVLSTDPEPEGDHDAIFTQCIQTEYILNYWVKTI